MSSSTATTSLNAYTTTAPTFVMSSANTATTCITAYINTVTTSVM
jgi:hypothetical protein